ncbi:MAG TPA: hypothetical protein VIC26_12475 [Marinagarivorans sp.]
MRRLLGGRRASTVKHGLAAVACALLLGCDGATITEPVGNQSSALSSSASSTGAPSSVPQTSSSENDTSFSSSAGLTSSSGTPTSAPSYAVKDVDWPFEVDHVVVDRYQNRFYVNKTHGRDIYVIDLRTTEIVDHLAMTGSITSVLLSENDQRLFITTADGDGEGALIIIDANTLSVIAAQPLSFEPSDTAAGSLSVLVSSGSQDGGLYLFDVDGHLLDQLPSAVDLELLYNQQTKRFYANDKTTGQITQYGVGDELIIDQGVRTEDAGFRHGMGWLSLDGAWLYSVSGDRYSTLDFARRVDRSATSDARRDFVGIAFDHQSDFALSLETYGIGDDRDGESGDVFFSSLTGFSGATDLGFQAKHVMSTFYGLYAYREQGGAQQLIYFLPDEDNYPVRASAQYLGSEEQGYSAVLPVPHVLTREQWTALTVSFDFVADADPFARDIVIEPVCGSGDCTLNESYTLVVRADFGRTMLTFHPASYFALTDPSHITGLKIHAPSSEPFPFSLDGPQWDNSIEPGCGPQRFLGDAVSDSLDLFFPENNDPITVDSVYGPEVLDRADSDVDEPNEQVTNQLNGTIDIKVVHLDILDNTPGYVCAYPNHLEIGPPDINMPADGAIDSD